MDSDCEKLIKWLNTFELNEPVYSISDLINGEIFYQILLEIAPDSFSHIKLSNIKNKTSQEDNVACLNNILKGLIDYCQKKMCINVNSSHYPDILVIAKESNSGEMAKFLKLILACAVLCENKQLYVEKIMMLEEEVQHFIMMAIKEIMSFSEAPLEPTPVIKTSKDSEAYRKLLKEKSEVEALVENLNKQLLAATEEKGSLKTEVEQLMNKLHLNSLENNESTIGRRLQTSQRQLEQCQGELFKTEALRDDYKLACEALEKENEQLHMKLEEMADLTKKNRDLRDEIDFLRHHADKAERHEETIGNLKKKLEGVTDMKSQLRFLEQRNSCYIEQNLHLQEEVDKMTQLKNQLETYKKQLMTLQTKCSEQNKLLDKNDFELKRCREKMSSLNNDKERQQNEITRLKETNEDLHMLLHTANAQKASADNGPPSFNLISPEVKEELLKLQHENKLLRDRLNTGEDGSTWKSLLSQSEQAKEELEVSLRTQNKKILELQARIEDLSEVSASNKTPLPTNHLKLSLNNPSKVIMSNTINLHTDNTISAAHVSGNTSPNVLSAISSNNANHKKHQNEAFPNSYDLKNQKKSSSELMLELEQVRLILKSKEEQIKGMELKYQNYLDKAKYIMQQEQRQLPQPAEDVISLQQELTQKDNYIKALQSTIKINETEQKLMLSAFYNLGVRTHKQNLESRLFKDHNYKLLGQPTQNNGSNSSDAQTFELTTNASPSTNSPALSSNPGSPRVQNKISDKSKFANLSGQSVNPANKNIKNTFKKSKSSINSIHKTNKTPTKSGAKINSVTPSSSSSSNKKDDK